MIKFYLLRNLSVLENDQSKPAKSKSVRVYQTQNQDQGP